MTVEKLKEQTYLAKVEGFDLHIETTKENRIKRIIGGSHQCVDEHVHRILQMKIDALA